MSCLISAPHSSSLTPNSSCSNSAGTVSAIAGKHWLQSDKFLRGGFFLLHRVPLKRLSEGTTGNILIRVSAADRGIFNLHLVWIWAAGNNRINSQAFGQVPPSYARIRKSTFAGTRTQRRNYQLKHETGRSSSLIGLPSDLLKHALRHHGGHVSNMPLQSPRPYFTAVVVAIADVGRIVKQRVIEAILIGRLVIGQHQAPNRGVASDERVQRGWGKAVGRGLQRHHSRGIVSREIGRKLAQLKVQSKLPASPCVAIADSPKRLPTSNERRWPLPLPAATAR
ncbi:hypothetical protein HUJ04_001096 [Dendroctonus ponderosae]|nr:hypothetical protein HUJ04_001096 [Dendroctonus ponderosae]